MASIPDRLTDVGGIYQKDSGIELSDLDPSELPYPYTTPVPPEVASPLDGVYIWNWYGYGGPASIGYTPRGKPAVDEIKALLQEL